MAVVDRAAQVLQDTRIERGLYRYQGEKKRPQPREDQPQSVPGPAHHRVQRVAELILEQQCFHRVRPIISNI